MHFYALTRNLKLRKMRITCINKWNVQSRAFFSRELSLFFRLVSRRYKSVAFKFQSTRNYRFLSFSRDTFEGFESTRLTFEFLIEKYLNLSLIQSYSIAERRLANDRRRRGRHKLRITHNLFTSTAVHRERNGRSSAFTRIIIRHVSRTLLCFNISGRIGAALIALLLLIPCNWQYRLVSWRNYNNWKGSRCLIGVYGNSDDNYRCAMKIATANLWHRNRNRRGERAIKWLFQEEKREKGGAVGVSLDILVSQKRRREDKFDTWLRQGGIISIDKLSVSSNLKLNFSQNSRTCCVLWSVITLRCNKEIIRKYRVLQL